ncbi:fibronectin type III domain-containing protein, partial [bacterium]|nr:fibronectin type III domain-containing protein [bacterium]
FFKGLNPQGKVVLSNKSSQPGLFVSADAVRFGGGMGRVARDGKMSHYPRFAEAARYNFQCRGLPDTLVYSFSDNQNDYRDDYMARPEFANYLNGAPCGPNAKREAAGLQIPIDLYFSFHTDAGITPDSTIGTLMIYSSTDQEDEFVFPDGVSRLANRDLGDLIQTEVVETIRKKYDPKWTRRALMDAKYAEARRPNMPSCLIELLSHQNFTDMRYGADPRFKFDVSRAMYRGMLKFLSTSQNRGYMMAPLPVNHFAIQPDGSSSVLLSWQPQVDVMDASAVAEKYLVQKRIGDGGFDNGFVVDDTTVEITDLEPGIIYSFQIKALNSGGESFPSEILAVCLNSETSPALIVNGFDRICGPAVVDEPNFKGFLHFLDAGVPDKHSFGFVGQQHDFTPDSKYRTNDAPGHGDSFADNETLITGGNSFDYPYVHGRAMVASGQSFVSCSDEAIEAGVVQLKNYTLVDWILGEEKDTPPAGKNPWETPFSQWKFRAFPEKTQQLLREFQENDGRLFVSGAYVGTSLMLTATAADSSFAAEVLKINWQTNYGSRTGIVFSAQNDFLPSGSELRFETQLSPEHYAVEAPDAIDPKGNAECLLRYQDNHFSAMIGARENGQIVVAGFPFESVLDPIRQAELMQAILNYLK